MKELLLIFLIVSIVGCTDQPKVISFTRQELAKNRIKQDSLMASIDTKFFWTLINEGAKTSNNDDEIKSVFLVSELSKLSLEDIKKFEIAFRKALFDADDFGVMGAQKILDGYVSDDSYLYFRCWLIGQGEHVYNETLKNPDFLAGILNDSIEFHEFEELIYVTTEAYAKVTGKKEDETFPRSVADNMGLNYDFAPPQTKGDDWTEEDLPTRFPKLWEKMN